MIYNVIYMQKTVFTLRLIKTAVPQRVVLSQVKGAIIINISPY